MQLHAVRPPVNGGVSGAADVRGFGRAFNHTSPVGHDLECRRVHALAAAKVCEVSEVSEGRQRVCGRVGRAAAY